MGSVMAHRMQASLGGTTDPQLVQLASNPDSIVSEATRQTLTPEAVDWLRTALSKSLDGVFAVGTTVAVVAFFVALAFPRGSAEELADRGEGDETME
jgi:hypothetical protein